MMATAWPRQLLLRNDGHLPEGHQGGPERRRCQQLQPQQLSLGRGNVSGLLFTSVSQAPPLSGPRGPFFPPAARATDGAWQSSRSRTKVCRSNSSRRDYIKHLPLSIFFWWSSSWGQSRHRGEWGQVEGLKESAAKSDLATPKRKSACRRIAGSPAWSKWASTNKSFQQLSCIIIVCAFINDVASCPTIHSCDCYYKESIVTHPRIYFFTL